MLFPEANASQYGDWIRILGRLAHEYYYCWAAGCTEILRNQGKISSFSLPTAHIIATEGCVFIQYIIQQCIRLRAPAAEADAQLRLAKRPYQNTNTVMEKCRYEILLSTNCICAKAL